MSSSVMAIWASSRKAFLGHLHLLQRLGVAPEAPLRGFVDQPDRSGLPLSDLDRRLPLALSPLDYGQFLLLGGLELASGLQTHGPALLLGCLPKSTRRCGAALPEYRPDQ